MNSSALTTGIVTQLPATDFQISPVLPRICVGPARALYLGPGLDLAPHLNVATTIAVSLEQRFGLRLWARGRGWSEWQSHETALIPSETLHHLKSAGPMAFLYLDPLADRRTPLNGEDLAEGRACLLRALPQLGIDTAFAAFGLAPSAPRDARIARVVRAIERHPQDFERLSDAAQLACLSPSRFRTRFAAEVGVPFRRYRLWRRMALVMRSLSAGGLLTEAAHEAGFASSAHLSSAFKALFGLPASELLSLGVAIDVSEDRLPSEGRARPDRGALERELRPTPR